MEKYPKMCATLEQYYANFLEGISFTRKNTTDYELIISLIDEYNVIEIRFYL